MLVYDHLIKYGFELLKPSISKIKAIFTELLIPNLKSIYDDVRNKYKI